MTILTEVLQEEEVEPTTTGKVYSFIVYMFFVSPDLNIGLIILLKSVTEMR